MEIGNSNLIFPTNGRGLTSKEGITMFMLANRKITTASLRCSSSSTLAVILR